MDDLKQALKDKGALAFFIVSLMILDGLIVSSILIVAWFIKFVARITGMESELITAQLDTVTVIGSMVIYTLWMILSIAITIKLIKSEVRSNHTENSSPDIEGE